MLLGYNINRKVYSIMKTFDTYEKVEGMRPCRKKPVLVHAIQVMEDFRCNSLEGDYKQGKAGDYLIKGVDGENYICDKEIFEKTYDWDNEEPVNEEYSIPECKTIEEFEKNFTLPESKVEPVNEVKVADTDLVEVEPVEEVPNVLNWELDRTGNIILGKEFLYDKHLIKVTTKLTFGENLPENEVELNKLPDYIYYLSMFDESYVGTDDILKFLKRNGIEFVMSHKLGVHEGRTACIGFAPKDNKWYGWSHRAFYGFTIGDVVADGDLTTSSGYVDEYIAEHPEADLSLPVGYTATNLDKAKRMAIAFADAVA